MDSADHAVLSKAFPMEQPALTPFDMLSSALIECDIINEFTRYCINLRRDVKFLKARSWNSK